MKQKIKLFKKDWVLILLLLVLSIPVVIPLIRSGFFHFSDEAHMANLYEMFRAIISGQFPPRFAPDMSYGFGYPLFNFYYPMPYYLGVFLYFINGSYIISFKILVFVSTLLSGVFFYKFLRLHVGKIQSFTGSLIYLYAPYRAVDLYVRGALGEIISFMFFPLIGIFVNRLAVKATFRNLCFLSITIALAILSHNLSPFLILPWFAVYFFIINKSGKKGIYFFVGSIILGLLLSSYWLGPALIESTLLKPQPQFNFYDHFPFIRQLIYSKWGYGASLPGIGDDISFQLGFANILIAVYVLYLLFKDGFNLKKKLLPLFMFCTLVFTMFLMNIRSRFIWEIFPLTNFVQFPWRFLMITTFITSVMVIFIRNKWYLGILLVTLLINVGYFKPSEYFNPTDDYFLNRYFANQQVAGETKTVSKEYLGWFEDYAILPKWVDKRADFLPPERITTENININNYQQLNPSSYSMDLRSDKGGILRTYLYYFPGWTAYLNNEKVNTVIERPYGNMLVEVPPGDWSFKLQWKETPFRILFDLVSMASLVTVVLGFFIKKYEKKT